jgi:hypothetical protein
VVPTDIVSMKPFFQGLVFGFLVMYGYLNYGADLLGPFRGWFNGAGNSIKHDRMRKEADEVIHGFLFQHNTGTRVNEGVVRS